MLTVICLLSVLVFIAADKDPLEFSEETCVKIFYTGESVYNIYCLNVLDEAGTMLGIVTDRNHKIIFKKNAADIEDESKICVNVLTETNVEKHCIDAIQHNCLSEQEDMKKHFPKTAENVPCHKLNMEETQLACMGVSHQDFTLIAYCNTVLSNIRRTIDNIPYNKTPIRQ